MNDNSYKKALDYAIRKHKGQFREMTETPYIIHPIRVSLILKKFGYYENKSLIIAALLHDVIEDTKTDISEIETLFGSKVAKIVDEVSRPKGMIKEDWLEKFTTFSKKSQILKMADRIDNLLDIERNSFPKVRKERYYKQTEIVIRNCGTSDIKLASILISILKKNKIIKEA